MPEFPRSGQVLGVRWHKVRRDLWLHKARTSLVVAAIVVGILGTGTVLDTWALLRQVTREGFLITTPAAATVRFDAVDAPLLSAIRALPAVRAATVRQTASARIRTRVGWQTAIVQAGDELAATDVAVIVRDHGAWPPADDGIVIEHSSLDFAGLAVGDTVVLQRGDGAAVTLPVRGVARDGSLAPGWMEHVVYAFVTPNILSALSAPHTALSDARVPSDVLFTVRGDPFDRDAIRRVARDVAAAGTAAGRRVISVTVPVPGEHVHAGQMNSLLYTQGAFGALSLLLSAFLVVNLMTAMLSGQAREIGIMKAMGARPAQLAAMYLVLALLLGAVASLVAIPIAALLGFQYADFAAELLNFDMTGTTIPPFVLLVQAGVGVLLPVLAAAVPVWRGCRVSVNDALRDHAGDHAGDHADTATHTGRAAGGRRLPWATLRGLKRPMVLSIRNAFRRRERMLFTLLTLSLGGAVYLGALGLRSSIRDSVDVLYGDIMRFDLVVRFDESHDASTITTLARSVDGIRDAEAWGGARAMRGNADGLVDGAFSITALPASSALIAYPVLAGQWLPDSLDRDSLPQLVVNQRLLAQEPSLSPGDTATLVIDGRSALWRIRGVVESGPSVSAYATPSTLSRVSRRTGARTLVMSTDARSLAGQAEVLQRVRDRFNAADLHIANADLMEASRAAIEDHMIMVSNFLLAMSQLTILIGGLGLASTMSLAVLERTREIGIMRAIGASHRAIFGIVQAEALVIAACSWLVAIPLSIPVSVLLADSFSRIMMPVPAHYLPDVGGMLLWFVVVMVVAALSAAWPARRAVSVPTATALAYE